jgi:hypothetical protein
VVVVLAEACPFGRGVAVGACHVGFGHGCVAGVLLLSEVVMFGWDMAGGACEVVFGGVEGVGDVIASSAWECVLGMGFCGRVGALVVGVVV